MNNWVQISGVGLQRACEETEIVSGLSILYPDGLSHSTFHLNLPESDARVPAVIDFLAKHGFQPQPSPLFRERAPREYQIEYYRQYSDADLEDCDIVRTRVDVGLSTLSQRPRDECGRLLIEFHKPHLPRFPIATSSGDSLLVRDCAISLFASVCATDCYIRPTVLVAWWEPIIKVIPWEEIGEEPWWEVIALRVLPPLAPCMKFYEFETGALLPPGNDRMCHVRDPDDPRDRLAQLHYCRSALDDTRPIYIARTLERFGAVHPLVISGSLCRALRNLGATDCWIPCHIDDC